MNFFNYYKDELYCEDVTLASIAKRFGTPCYVYSYQTLVKHFNRLGNSWKPVDVLLTYSVKSNSNLAILRIFKNLGAWVDVVSQGEIFRALKAGFQPKQIVFGGVGKTKEEINYAIKTGVFLLIIDSEPELEMVTQQARRLGNKVNIALRINPDINPKTHPYIATGLKISKFGIARSEALRLYRKANSSPWLNVIGIHHHIGSQVTELGPFLEAFEKTSLLVARLKSHNIPIHYIDIGGGIGITYKDEEPFALEELARGIISFLVKLGVRLIIEPGRVIVGNAGILLTKVIYIKTTAKKNFVIVDAGMNDLIRPTFYNAYHEIRAVNICQRRFKADVVGPICESGDFFAKERLIPKFSAGGLMAIMSAGAYGFTMTSNYNSRPRVAEVLVKGNQTYLIRKREPLTDLIKGEQIPKFLKKG